MSVEMKDSGINWIGEIPKHWEVKRFKNFIELINTPSCSLNKIGLENIEGETGHFIPSESKFEGNGIQFLVNNIVYGKLRPYLQKVWLATFDGNAVGDFFVFKTQNNSIPKYVKWLMLSDGFTKMVDSSTYGAKMPRVASDFILNLPFYLPSVEEQYRIANFLDKKCAEIDELIVLQEQMIAQLNTYKQAVITETVTKGLDPNVKMKDSGVEWIGEIPEHWELRKIGTLFRLSDERNYKSMEEVQLLSLYTGIGVFPHGEQEERGNKAVTVQGYKIVHKNDVVVNIILAWMGAIGVSNYDGVTSPAYDVYIPNRNVIPHYFHYVFRTKGIADECYKYGRGIMMMRWRTYSSEFKQILIPYPSISEQQSIAQYLDQKCKEIDELISIKKEKIEHLKAYKKSVIYEYVTGKKQVV